MYVVATARSVAGLLASGTDQPLGDYPPRPCLTGRGQGTAAVVVLVFVFMSTGLALKGNVGAPCQASLPREP